MAEDPLYVCPCGYGPKPYFSAMGHRGRSKNPLCKTGDLRQVSGSTPARDESAAEPPAASAPSASEAAPVAALGMEAGPAREPSPQLETTPARDNGHVPVNQPREGSERKETVKTVTPSTVKPAVVLPMSVYVFYDAWRAHFDYQGGFDEWVAEVVDHYMDLAGFELTITARPRVEAVA